MKIKHIIIIALGILLMLSCQKKNYFPTVIIDSVETNGKITTIKYTVSENDGDVPRYSGICFDTIPDPYLTTNQVLTNGQSRSISVENLTPETTLYFKAFVSNSYGYTESSAVEYTIPYDAIPVAPCSLSDDTFVRNGTSYNVSSSLVSTGAYNEYKLSIISSGVVKANFEFQEKPLTGIYTIVSSYNGYENDNVAKVSFQHPIFNGMAWTGATSDNVSELVYIENNNMGSLTISFCNLSYNYDNVEYNLQGKYIKVD